MPTYRRPDFNSLKGIPIEDVLHYLGIDLKKKGKQLRGQCPVCLHPSSRAFTVTPDMNRFWCHGYCRSGGDTIELVSRVKQITAYDAACELQKTFGPP